MTEKYFFDTYAFIEILKGNPNYKKYQNVGVLTTKFNLMELHYWLLSAEGGESADKYYDKYEKFAAQIDSSDIKLATRFRLENKKANLSYADCLGYVMAKTRNALFLTGDKAFSGIKNVEFVK
ncbi:MAG TPA: PIN domain-containing protein [archaeon]|nr:PIN domain-containing protein [archaeon]